MTLTSRRATFITHTRAKNEVSGGLKARAETDKLTDATDRITVSANAVGD